LIWRLKFERTKSAGLEIGDMLFPAMERLGTAETLVVHVPTATGRVRRRGYDQAAVIAKSVARQANLPHVSLLSRAGQQQRAARRTQRRKQLQEAFWISKPYLAKGAHIILVDVVVTTGAALEAAALKAAGARRIEAIVFAQA
jgi:predicted amidophosphoribosyltransferase